VVEKIGLASGRLSMIVCASATSWYPARKLPATIATRIPFTNLPIEIELHGLTDFSRQRVMIVRVLRPGFAFSNAKTPVVVGVEG